MLDTLNPVNITNSTPAINYFNKFNDKINQSVDLSKTCLLDLIKNLLEYIEEISKEA